MQTRRQLYELIGYHDYEALDQAIAQSVLPDERRGARADQATNHPTGHGGP
jgi:hypothetical protein